MQNGLASLVKGVLVFIRDDQFFLRHLLKMEFDFIHSKVQNGTHILGFFKEFLLVDKPNAVTDLAVKGTYIVQIKLFNQFVITK